MSVRATKSCCALGPNALLIAYTCTSNRQSCSDFGMFLCLPSLHFQKLAVDISNALSPSKDNKQKAGQKGKNKKQLSKSRKRVAGLTFAYSTLRLYSVTIWLQGFLARVGFSVR